LLRQIVTDPSLGFLEKVKSGNAKQAGSGFGGKGLDKLDRDREEKDKVQRTVYGEREEGKVEEKVADGATAGGAGTDKDKEDPMTFGDFKVEIRRGPAPDTSKAGNLFLSASARAAKVQQDEKLMQSQIKAMEDEAARQDKTSAEYRKAMSVIAKLNAQFRAAKLMGGHGLVDDASAARKKDPDATDYHAIIPINDYPQKARWKVTNKETMSQVRRLFFP
jgi:ATP-dependent RNA helicase DDX46/PRP5